MSVVIYHNPRCSKSRQTLTLLQEHGQRPRVVEYLESPPDAKKLASILHQLGVSASELMRKGEDEYKLMATRLATMSEAEQIEWLAKHPRVMERPVVVSAKGARIGRPPERVLEILD